MTRKKRAPFTLQSARRDLLSLTKGHGACDMVFGKRFCSKNLRDTVLAIWALGRGSFQNSRGTVLAIECLGRIFKKKTKGHGACDLGFGKG